MLLHSGTGDSLYFSYDALGRRLAMTDHDSGTTSYGYDSLGRQTEVTNPFGEATRFTYNDAARTRTTHYANGLISTIFADELGRESKRVTTLANGSTLASFESCYDPVGNRVSLTEHNGVVTNYAYDAAGGACQ